MNEQAIVIVWVGRQPSQEEISVIGNYLLENRIVVTPELLDIKHLDSDSISKAICIHAEAFNEKRLQIQMQDEDTCALEQACIFVGESFKDLIPNKNSNKTYVNFMLEFQKRLTEAKIKMSAGVADKSESALINATTIICEQADEINKNMLRHAGINNLAIQIIKSIAKQIL